MPNYLRAHSSIRTMGCPAGRSRAFVLNAIWHCLPLAEWRATAGFAAAFCEPMVGGDSFEIRLLGPVKVLRAGRELAVGGRRQRELLALLVLERGGPTSTERPVDELWRGTPPAGFAVTLRSYVSRLLAS
jgi:hypothetical protein